MTHAYFARPMLMRMVVPTASATDAEQLVGDAEQRPDRVDAAGPDEVAPRQDHERGRDRARSASSSVSPNSSTPGRPILQQETADARARIDRRQDEDRLEHDGEVVPVGHQAACPGCEKICAMPTASETAPPVRPITFSCTCTEASHGSCKHQF